MDYPDLGGDSSADDCFLFSERRRFLIPPRVAFYSLWTGAQGAISGESQSQTLSPAPIYSPNLDIESLPKASPRNAFPYENTPRQYDYSAPRTSSNAFSMDSVWPEEVPLGNQQGSDWQASSLYASCSGLFRLRLSPSLQFPQTSRAPSKDPVRTLPIFSTFSLPLYLRGGVVRRSKSLFGRIIVSSIPSWATPCSKREPYPLPGSRSRAPAPRCSMRTETIRRSARRSSLPSRPRGLAN